MPSHTPSERRKKKTAHGSHFGSLAGAARKRANRTDVSTTAPSGTTAPIAGLAGAGVSLAGRRRRGLPAPKTAATPRRGGPRLSAFLGGVSRLRQKAAASPLLKRRRRPRRTF